MTRENAVGRKQGKLLTGAVQERRELWTKVFGIPPESCSSSVSCTLCEPVCVCVSWQMAGWSPVHRSERKTDTVCVLGYQKEGQVDQFSARGGIIFPGLWQETATGVQRSGGSPEVTCGFLSCRQGIGAAR
jgi:hypothetical protein